MDSLFEAGYSAYSSLILLAITVTTVYFYYDSTYSFFKKQNIPGPTPLPFFGNLIEQVVRVIPDLEIERYQKYGKVYGYFDGSHPILNISDLQVIKNILIRDFDSFVDRRNRNTNGIMRHTLLSLKGNEWRMTRNTLSPTFTSGKMKMMMQLMSGCADDLLKSLEKKAKSGEDINVKDLFGFFTMDVVAKCAFATETHVQDMGYDNPFMKQASQLFTPPKTRMAIRMLLPKLTMVLYKLTNMFKATKTQDQDSMGYLEEVVRSIIKQRSEMESNERSYKDFLQLLLDAMQGKDLEDQENLKETELHHVNGEEDQQDMRKGTLSEDSVVANAILVLVAGYETTATLLTYTSYSLAKNPEKQEILRKEIKAAYEAAGNQLLYQDISSLKYLDAVIMETLRMYPPVVRLSRQCTKDYSLEVDGKTILVKKGDEIRIPSYAIHHDNQFYPNHDQWNPERFLPENKDKLTPYTYLPFGGGPRNCIGMRFALLEAKLAISKTLLEYRFIESNQTPDKIDFKNALFLLTPGKIALKVEKL